MMLTKEGKNMITTNDFKTAEEQIEYIKGIIESTQKIIKGFKEEYSSGYVTRKELEELIELEKVGTYNLIEEFLSGEED